MLKPKEIEVVLYHGGNCPDGFGAAWAAHQLLGHKAIYLPVNYHEDVPVEEIQGKNVALLDFSYKEEKMNSLVNWSKDYIVIDHHESAKRYLKNFDNCIFDMNHSGAVLAWKYFHPDKIVPDMLLYVEDRDIWKWKLKKSEEYLSYLDTIPQTFDGWTAFNSGSTEVAIAKGSCVVDFKNMQAERAVRAAKPGRFLDQNMMIVNISDKSIISKALNQLAAEHYGVAMSYFYDHEKDMTFCSFRSTGQVNVAKLAERVKGGGHAKASGCELKGTINQYLQLVKE